MPEAVRRTLREVDPAQPMALGVEELDEDVEVAQRQPVRALEARRELPRHRGIGPEETEPGRLRQSLGKSLSSQYLTRQDSLAMIVDSSSIQISA